MSYINKMIDNPDEFEGFDMSSLRMDEAFLQIINSSPNSIYIYELISECIKCPYKKFIAVPSGSTLIKLKTRFKTIYRLLNTQVGATHPVDNDDFVCGIKQDFGQFGVYKLETNGIICNTRVLKQPVNIYLPILTVILIYSIFFLIPLYSIVKKYVFKKDVKNESDPVTTKERLKSLDTFRGISIVLMIFVNYGGGGYVFTDHAVWNGLQVADLVFPWFLWIMGVCIPISIRSVLKKETPKGTAFLNILRRSCTLFAIGLFLGSGTNLEKLRIFGVLQRFGICYLVVATMCLFLMEVDYAEFDRKWKNYFSEILHTYKMWIIILIILIIYCLVIFLVEIDGCPKGYLGPGGFHENGKYFNCTGGVTGHIDEVILGNHIYQYPTIKEIYNSKPFDPEGIFGCLTSIIQVFLGVKAGIILLTIKCYKKRAIRWTFWAFYTGLIGAVLCGFSKENGVIPLNKNLWSLSFVLVTSSLAFLLLTFCYLLIDVIKIWNGKPFLFAGMNAIIMYIGHSITYSNFPIRWDVDNNETHFLRLFENVWGTMCWILVSYYLYKKKIFYSI
nr:heparan-alpha-glucosaminide N-acetyltransferase [Onthophagus taurus]XP_022916137.1 heparan-alpha-glucosaminide N-acetyltransferase [Onthophagus taurus]XP_022916138.1 heparan-alpha-glucosaminide N-acetyltransferase [Onthophagus taurus]